MPNTTIRINTQPNGADRFVKVNIEQEFDFIEVLSLKISQQDAYRNFCSDYGVVTGRVIVNNAFGVPNAKVSIFIPIDEIDALDAEILGLYPYEIVSDKNSDGIRYNLLPTTSDSGNECHTPIGTFPAKREILDNPIVMDIYQKYYKFTTTSNFAGDYMIFGVPIGNYTIHVDADISDIGIISQRPYDSIAQGASPKLFDSSTKYKGGTNLDKLVQVKSANASVNVLPFWGNSDTCEVGINRVDLDLNYTIIPSAIFMGNIFGDQDKNSVNKNCIPRKNLGEICDQATGEGTVEMIRETPDGKIESFDIEGGRVIDDNGSWAYQIPMNLDYIVTDENGNLIPSDDPNKGIPTRANVRFRIAMDQTGGEGRLRTRAKYLVPNNPSIPAEIDYEFSDKTKLTSLRSIYWNKIYSVSNFISRFQKSNILLGGLASRNTTGIKNVDGCGDKTPFPFNRVNTTFNPIFFIICLIIKVLGSLIYVINAFFVPIINAILDAINAVLKVIYDILNAIIKVIRKVCKTLHFKNCPEEKSPPNIGHVMCVYVECPSEDGDLYAPGCTKGSPGYDAAVESGNPITYYPGDPSGHGGGLFNLVGLDDCISIQMAAALGLFEFDFYNDWINGSIYAFLLKYKRRRRGKEKFCEYDCEDFGISAGGVDGDKDGDSDNDCNKNNIVDSCFTDGDSKDAQKEFKSKPIREGLIKKYKDEFYYAATTHNVSNKLFATDLINLGAVFNCDWQTVPKLQQYLLPTTYNIPPLTQEVADDEITVLTTGQCDIDGNTFGLFFSINCLGLHVNQTQCLNIRHLCEFGVELDEFRDGVSPDGVIGKKDLDLDDADRPKWFRDVFAGLNFNQSTWDVRSTWDLNGLPYATNFNNQNAGNYDWTASGSPVIVNGILDGTINGPTYIGFRGYPLNDINNLTQPKHSYYFYFGLLPGKTALDKMNQKYFAPCPPKPAPLFDVEVTTIAATYSDSTTAVATITFFNGVGPYSGTVSGPNGYTLTFTVGQNNTKPEYVINGLNVGSYTITGNDSKGNIVTEAFVMSPPPSLYADAVVSSNSTNAAFPNGKIKITLVGGGSTISKGTYSYGLYASNGTLISSGTFSNVGFEITNLGLDAGPNHTFTPITGHGYTLQISDSVNSHVYIPNLVIRGASAVNIKILPPETVECYGDLGTLNFEVTGGIPPYIISVTAQATGVEYLGTKIPNLAVGTYIIRVQDSFGTITSVPYDLKSTGQQMTLTTVAPEELQNQCSTTEYSIGVIIGGDMNIGDKFVIQFSGQDPAEGGTRVYTKSFPVEFKGVGVKTFLTIPKADVVDSIVLRMTDTILQRCFSPLLVIDIFEVELPPVQLTIETTEALNTKQCLPNNVSIKFDISHLTAGYTIKTPYSLNYTVVGKNGGTSTTSGVIPNITANQQLITLPVVLINGITPASSCDIFLILKDSTGCPSPTKQLLDIKLPTKVLTSKWDDLTISGGFTNYVFRAFDGIPPYTGNTYEVGVVYKQNPAKPLTSTVNDSVGCTSTSTSK